MDCTSSDCLPTVLLTPCCFPLASTRGTRWWLQWFACSVSLLPVQVIPSAQALPSAVHHPLAFCLSLQPSACVAPYPRAGNPIDSALCQHHAFLVLVYTAFQRTASHFSSSISSQDKHRFGVVVATCFVRCTLLSFVSALHERPCFLCTTLVQLSLALITSTTSRVASRPFETRH